MELRESVVRWGWVLPLVALALLLGGTVYLDRQSHEQLESRRSAAAAEAERDAAALAERIASEVASRVGALAAAKLQFTQVEDSLSQRTFVAAVDSVIGRLPGLMAVSIVYPSGWVVSSRMSALEPRVDPMSVPELSDAYERASIRRQPAATPVLRMGGYRRVVVFDPVSPSDTASIQAMLMAEIDPIPILRAALEEGTSARRPAFYDLYDPAGRRINTVPAPEGWPTVRHPVRVADSEWSLFVAHQPLSERSFIAMVTAIRVAGGLLAVAFSLLLLLLWRMVTAQHGEIRLRRAAESQAQGVTDQLRSAQETSLRLSGAMDPDRVIDEFLGAVGVEIGADVGRIYAFEESGDVLVGRRLVVLDPGLWEDGAPSEQAFQEVRLPVTLMPHLAEPVATGEPYLAGSDSVGTAPGQEGRPSANATLVVPLAIGGNLVGLAVWESHRPDGRFEDRAIPFAQAVATHAAAALQAAELMDGVRQAQERAHKEAVRLATVLDQMGDGVVLFDRDGRPERVNAAAEALLGPALAITPLAEWPQTFRISQASGSSGFPPADALNGRDVDDARLTLRHQGLERYLAVSAAPIRGPDDSVRGAALVVRDVTAEHEYAEMLRYTNQELRQQATLLERTNDELRAATAAKDQFLAMMSHELRTPINAVIGYSEILALGIHGELGDRQQWMLSRVRDTSGHLLGLIEDVLDLAKIGAGRIDMDIREVPLEPVLERATTQVLPLASEKGLRIQRTGAAGLQVVADEMRLLQILINLASNAVKFTEEGGLTLRVEESDYHALIHVEDTGPGIPPEQLESVFEEFHQVDAGLARKAGGTGLGLTISRRLARLMGGDLTVESAVGVGTTFTAQIPLAQRQRVGGSEEREGEDAA